MTGFMGMHRLDEVATSILSSRWMDRFIDFMGQRSAARVMGGVLLAIFVGGVVVSILGVQYVLSDVWDEWLTLSAVVRFVGFAVLANAAGRNASTSDISSKMLYTNLLSESCRLAAEFMQHSDLPEESCYVPEHEGAWFYHPVCFGILFMNLVAAFRVKTRSTEADDGFPMWKAVVVALLLSLPVIHYSGVASKCGTFQDYTWAASHWLDAMAIMSQMWAITRNGVLTGNVSNAIALFIIAKVMTGLLWVTYYGLWMADNGVSEASLLVVTTFPVMASHGAYFLVSADFMFVFLKSSYSRQVEVKYGNHV